MMKILYLSIIAIPLLIILVPTIEAPKSSNILLIVVDDQQYSIMTKENMPTVYWRIGQQGITFDNYYVTTGLCCPSRSSMLTGLYAHNHHVWGNTVMENGGATLFDDRDTIATLLSKHGYKTGYFGKYLNDYWRVLQSKPDHVARGWDAWYALREGSYFAPEIQQNDLNNKGRLVHYDSSTYTTDLLKDKVIDFISQQKNRPFFVVFAPFAPHTDITTGMPQPAPRHQGLCVKMQLPHTPSWNETDISDKPSFISHLPLISVPNSNYLDALYRNQVCSLKAVDEDIKQITDVLGPSGSKEMWNTAVIFTSDNGFFMGEHRLTGKYQLYEEAVHVPLLIRYPNVIKHSSVRHDLVANIDLAPTIADIAGVKMEGKVNGKSLVPLFTDTDNPAKTWRDSLLIEQHRNGNQSAIKFGNYVYMEHKGSPTSIIK